MSPITGYVSGCLGSVLLPDADLAAWVAAVVVAGGSVSAGRKTLVGTLIAGLKTDGLWTKLDRLWLHAGENSQSALVDLVARELASATAAPTFTTDRGYTFNGTSNSLQTAYNPGVTAPAHFALNSAMIASYDRDIGIVGGAQCMFGCFNTSTVEIRGNSATDFELQINAGTRQTIAGVYTIGFWTSSRTGSTTTNSFKNGSAISPTGTDVSTSLPGHVMTIGALNGTTDFCDHQIAASIAGAGITSTDAGNLSSRINTYMTAIGANVF